MFYLSCLPNELYDPVLSTQVVRQVIISHVTCTWYILLFQNVCGQFDVVSDANHSSGKHVQTSETTDLQKIVQLLSAMFFKKLASVATKGLKTSMEKSLTDPINAEKF